MKSFIKNFKSNFIAQLINYYPPFISAGIKANYLSKDFRVVKVSMKLTWYNRNYVGTHFGGSLYSMVDPWYMLMLIKNLGTGYIVWDKAAHINYLRPGKGKVFADFVLTQEILDEIKEKLQHKEKLNLDFKVSVKDESERMIAEVIKVIYVSKKKQNSNK